MVKQMCWLSAAGIDGDKILYLRLNAGDSWKPYTSFKQFARPDYRDFFGGPEGSKGWATFQHLMKNGWTLIPSEQAYSDNFISNKAA